MRRVLDVVLVALVVLGATLAACGRGDDKAPDGTNTTTTLSPDVAKARFPADQIVWQTRQESPLSEVATAARRPAITIYGDGRVFLIQPALDPRYDQPVPLRTGKISLDDLALFVGRVEASGLLETGDHFGEPAETDLPWTAVTLHGKGAKKELRVYALGGRFDDDVTPEEAERREQLRILLHDAEGLVPKPEPSTPDRVRVLRMQPDATFVPKPDDDEVEELPAWRGPELKAINDAAPAGMDAAVVLGCAEVTGEPAASLFDAALKNPTPQWMVGTAQQTFVVAALLPGEAACG